jgi:shikimate dehydrogenase
MRLFGLIGYPLEHSFSPRWFTDKFVDEGISDAEYRLFPLTSIEQFPGLLQAATELSGLNVTIPYKEKIIPYLDALDPLAAEIGAVNTIRITRSGGRILTTGFNTDAPGFLSTLAGDIPPGPALILGTGGAARAVAYALSSLEIDFLYVSRHVKNSRMVSYDDLTPAVMEKYRLIVNATPVGMFPGTDLAPAIPYHLITARHFLYDLVYNPEETVFLRNGKAVNARTMNGLQMLKNQAERSFRIFTDPPAPAN